MTIRPREITIHFVFFLESVRVFFKKPLIVWLVSVLAMLFLIEVTLIFVVNISTEKSLYWPGWYLLKLPDDKDADSAIEYLHSQVDNVLSAETARIRYMGIPHLHTVTVDKIDTVLPVGDPRRDPFIQKVHEFFQMGSSSLVYLPANRRISFYKQILNMSPDLDGALLLDDVRMFQWGAVLYFVLALGGLCWLLPCGTLPMFIAFLSWIVPVQAIGFPMVFWGLSLFVLATYRYTSNTRVDIASILGTIMVLVLIVIYMPLHIFVSVLVAGLGSETIGWFHRKYDFFSRIKLKKCCDHQIFEPLPLMNSLSLLSAGWGRGLLKFILVVFLLLPSGFPYNRIFSHEPVPAANLSIGSYDSSAAIYSLSKLSHELPDISSLIASLAYQTDFLHGAQFGLPLPGEKLTQHIYMDSEDRITVMDVMLRAYDAKWYADIVKDALTSDVGQLFSTLDGPASISMVSTPLYGELDVRIPLFLMMTIIGVLFFIYSLRFFRFKGYTTRYFRQRRARTQKRIHAA